MEKQGNGGNKDGGMGRVLWFDMSASEHWPAVVFIIHGILCNASELHCWGIMAKKQEERKGGRRGEMQPREMMNPRRGRMTQA